MKNDQSRESLKDTYYTSSDTYSGLSSTTKQHALVNEKTNERITLSKWNDVVRYKPLQKK